MKAIFSVFLFFLSACAHESGYYNVPDIEDTNRIPAEEEKLMNPTSDVPGPLQKRANPEERIYPGDAELFD